MHFCFNQLAIMRYVQDINCANLLLKFGTLPLVQRDNRSKEFILKQLNDMFWRPQGICMKLKDNTRSLPLSFIMFYGGFIQATSFCRKSRDWSGESQCRGSCEALKPERVTKFSKHFVPERWKSHQDGNPQQLYAWIKYKLRV